MFGASDFNQSYNSSSGGCFSDTSDIYTFVLLPEFVSLAIFAVAIWMMYRGIEIDHPVFRILFNNLIFQFFATAVIIIGEVSAGNRKVAILFSQFGNIVARLFHHCSWMILSFLRYSYIDNPDWLQSTWPEPTGLRNLSQALVLGSFSLITTAISVIFLTSLIPLGWPSVSYFDLPPAKRVLVLVPIMLLYLVPVLVSSSVYLKLVCTVVKKASARVDVVVAQEQGSADTNGRIYTGSAAGSGRGNLDPSVASSCPSPVGGMQPTGAQEATRANEEKSSALRALKTNILVFVAGMVVVSVTNSIRTDYQQCITVISDASFKLLLPILTTIANFVTVQSLLKRVYALFFSTDGE